jgi:hypothetical protein
MIASHNTLTYMRPVQWWARLLRWTARCQKKNFSHQLAEGIRLIDIRVRHAAKDGWYVSHGLTRYCRLEYALDLAEASGLPVRLLIEGKYDEDLLNDLFITIGLSGVTVYECRDKRTWEQLIPGIPSLDVEQYVGSMQSWYGKIFPCLYTMFNRKKLYRQMAFCRESKTGMALFDFI